MRKIDNLVEPKKKSRFIADAVRKRIDDLQQERTEALLSEGYKARRSESLTGAKEFEAVDIEGWADY